MTSSYPSGLDAFDTIASDKKTSDTVGGRTHRDMHNDLGDAIEAVQAELGTDPSGASATVKARFEAIEAHDWVTSARIAADAVGTSEIANAAVTDAKLAGSITPSKITGTALTASTVDAKGDLLVGTAADTVARLAAGADGTLLTADSAQAGGLKWTTQKHLSGTGTPESVITAPPGSTWLQTDSTTDVKGWIRWVKATGTGSTGWVAGPEADTGWRDISTLLTSGLAPSSADGCAWLRRRGTKVDWLLRLNVTAGSIVDITVGTPPSGFVNAKPLALPFYTSTSANASIPLTAASAYIGSGALKSVSSLPNPGTMHLIHTWDTADAWPTSLPGSPA